jgi:alpha-glucoside transport system permease protein
VGNLARGLTAIVLGVGGAMLLFWVLNAIAERLPKKWGERLRPYAFVGPALAIVGVFLLYPSFVTIVDSFRVDIGRETERWSTANYEFLVTDRGLRRTLFNNVLWVVFVPAFAVAVGLAVAVLADKLRPRCGEARQVGDLPADGDQLRRRLDDLAVHLRLARARTAADRLLNAIWTASGRDPVAWVQQERFFLSSFTLIVIMIWLQAGFAMVLLSAAIKGVPEDTIEAARIDGATEVQAFWRVVVPQIRSTIVVVATTILILVLKVFDIVYVMGRGRFGTDVIANRFITELLVNFQNGRAAVIVVFLIAVTIPFMIINIRRFREQEATR